MKTLLELQEQYYEEFKGLPSFNPIVRNNQPNDAFELAVLKVMYGKYLPEFTKEHAAEFSKYIIAPPDNAIDIFYQHDDGDESSFDVIQVKCAELSETELKDCIVKMERTIEDYCKNPSSIASSSCKEILSKSNLDKTNKKQCTYYVVHLGSQDDFAGSNENEKVITLKALDVIYKNKSVYVDKDVVNIDTSMTHDNIEAQRGAIVCSINGYDLATLCNTYYSMDAGRNLLFGSNLRESLITPSSKPFLAMSQTITDCPENFWYYNNGITIIARDIVKKSSHTVELNDFSIVNGAQTTSALGLFLKLAKNERDVGKIANLKKVSVLARLLKVPDEQMRQDIAIYNNTQTPITSRDIVANRKEQRYLNEWLLNDDYPQIYVEIRRGSQLPSTFNKGIVHRKTTNEELAQLVYASFLQKPHTAKDKKKALFNHDYTQSEYTINKIYHDVFNWVEEGSEDNGIIFKKTKQQIDELLFVQLLYKETKKVMKATLSERIEIARRQRELATSPEEIRSSENRISTNTLHL
ncbi:MAG: AIPR family protein, partial [Clostridia bacterium]|nr:AIPR family protein [Clostridia bacterium]